MPSSEIHLRVLRLLEANPHLTQRELADELGISLGKANYCLKALLVKGLVKMQNFGHARNKLSYAYLLTPSGIAAKARLTTEYLQIKMNEFELLKREIRELRYESSRSRTRESR